MCCYSYCKRLPYPAKSLEGLEITLRTRLAPSVEMQLTLLSPDAGIKHVTVTPGRYHSEKCWALIEPYNSSSPPLSTAIDAEAYGSYKAQHSTGKYNS